MEFLGCVQLFLQKAQDPDGLFATQLQNGGEKVITHNSLRAKLSVQNKQERKMASEHVGTLVQNQVLPISSTGFKKWKECEQHGNHNSLRSLSVGRGGNQD